MALTRFDLICSDLITCNSSPIPRNERAGWEGPSVALMTFHGRLWAWLQRTGHNLGSEIEPCQASLGETHGRGAPVLAGDWPWSSGGGRGRGTDVLAVRLC